MPCFTGRRASSRSYVVFWVSPKWSHSFPGRHRSPLGLAPFVIDTPSVDVMGHARQASSTYARFDRLDIASGGRQRPSHFHPIVDTHPHTHTPIFSTQSSLVVTHAYAVGTVKPQNSHFSSTRGSWLSRAGEEHGFQFWCGDSYSSCGRGDRWLQFRGRSCGSCSSCGSFISRSSCSRGDRRLQFRDSRVSNEQHSD